MTTSIAAELFKHSFTANNNLFKVQFEVHTERESNDSLSNSLTFRVQNFPSINLTPSYIDLPYRNLSLSQPAPTVNDPKRISGLKIIVEDDFKHYTYLKSFLLHDDQHFFKLISEDNIPESIEPYVFNMKLTAYTMETDHTKNEILIPVYEWSLKNCILVKISPLSFNYASIEPPTVSCDIIYSYIEEKLCDSHEFNVNKTKVNVEDLLISEKTLTNKPIKVSLEERLAPTKLKRGALAAASLISHQDSILKNEIDSKKKDSTLGGLISHQEELQQQLIDLQNQINENNYQIQDNREESENIDDLISQNNNQRDQENENIRNQYQNNINNIIDDGTQSIEDYLEHASNLENASEDYFTEETPPADYFIDKANATSDQMFKDIYNQEVDRDRAIAENNRIFNDINRGYRDQQKDLYNEAKNLSKQNTQYKQDIADIKYQLSISNQLGW